MDKKTIYAIVAVVVVLLIVGVAGVMLLNNGGNGDTTPTPTPTEAPSAADATSLQFAVTLTPTDADAINYEYQVKNLNAADEKLRVDMDLGDAGTFIYIVDLGAQESWMSMDDGATWIAGNFADDCTAYATPFHEYFDEIVADGGIADFTYTTDAGEIAISCITINPTIDDSVFATS